ncbi:MAG: hypothetical protein WDZ90_02465 [Candidatus Paceibacterota bacterium]
MKKEEKPLLSEGLGVGNLNSDIREADTLKKKELFGEADDPDPKIQPYRLPRRWPPDQ